MDLLHTVDCTAAVSFKVNDPYDFPKHLVGGAKAHEVGGG